MAQPLREAATDQLRLPYCTLRSLRVRAAYHCIGLDKKYKDTNTHSPLSESESRNTTESHWNLGSIRKRGKNTKRHKYKYCTLHKMNLTDESH